MYLRFSVKWKGLVEWKESESNYSSNNISNKRLLFSAWWCKNFHGTFTKHLGLVKRKEWKKESKKKLMRQGRRHFFFICFASAQ